MVSPIILSGSQGPRFFFNLDANVGPDSPNRPDDVQLVQMGFQAMARNPLFRPKDPKDEQILRRALGDPDITPGRHYGGGRNEVLSLVINLYQAFRGDGSVRDGHVSVIRGTTGSYDNVHSYLLIPMNNSLMDVNRRSFPRLDLLPECPTQLRSAIQKMLLGGVG